MPPLRSLDRQSQLQAIDIPPLRDDDFSNSFSQVVAGLGGSYSEARMV